MASISRDTRGKSVRYFVNWRDPATGKGRRKSFPTRKAADDYRRKVEVGQAGHADEKVTVREWVESRIEFRYSDPARLATREQVEQRMNRHVYPHLGGARLGRLDVEAVESWVLTLKGKGLATSTIKVIASNLRTFLDDAVNSGVLVRNPVSAATVRNKIREDYAERPAWEVEDEGRVSFWSPETVAAVTEAIRKDLRLMVEIGAGIGVRQGELLALAVDDFDFDAGVVRVRSQVKVLSGTRLVFADLKHRGKAKGKDRERVVPLPPILAGKVRAHIESGAPRSVTMPWAHPEGRPITRELLFVTREGKAWCRNYLNVLWRKATAAAGLGPERQNGMHALRHYYASVLIDAGVPLPAVADYLGHASAEFTLRQYAHRMPTADTRALAALSMAERYATGTQDAPDNVVDLRKLA